MFTFNYYTYASVNLLAHTSCISNYFFQINSQKWSARSNCGTYIDMLTNFTAERSYQLILYCQGLKPERKQGLVLTRANSPANWK